MYIKPNTHTIHDFLIYFVAKLVHILEISTCKTNIT